MARRCQALAGLYVGFILDAMAMDFFPRLTPVVHERVGCRRLVNEQVEVGLLLAGPGVLATLTFAGLVIQVCYSAKFGPAVEILRWISLGMLLRVASWPMGFILRASGAAGPVFWTELAKHSVHAALVWYCVLRFGLRGAGIGFFAGYVLYAIGIYVVVRIRHGFRWSAANVRLGLFYCAPVTVVFASWYLLDRPIALVGGAMLAGLSALHSARRLWELDPAGWLPRRARQLLARFNFDAPRAAS